MVWTYCKRSRNARSDRLDLPVVQGMMDLPGTPVVWGRWVCSVLQVRRVRLDQKVIPVFLAFPAPKVVLPALPALRDR
jgi:hypothetical protein